MLGVLLAAEDVPQFAEPVEEVLGELLEPVEEVLEDVAELQGGFEPLILSLGEWLNEVLNLFSDTLGQIMSSPVLRFFAVFGVFLVAWWLALRLISAGKTW